MGLKTFDPDAVIMDSIGVVGATTPGVGRVVTFEELSSLVSPDLSDYWTKSESDTRYAAAIHGHAIGDISGLSAALAASDAAIISLNSTKADKSTTLTINGTALDLSASRSWTVGDLRSDSSYSNPTWLTGLAWGKVSGTPTTLSGYGITNAYTKTEVDNLVAGLLDFKGNLDCSANPNYPAGSKGDAYYVSVAGKIGGASGKSVEVGDLIVASADNAGGTEASVGTSWFVLEHNLAGALVASNNLSDLTSASTARGNLGLGTLATQSGTFSGTSSGTNTGDQTITLTGDVTGSGTGSFATTIANSAVTNAMLAGSIAISKLAITGTPDSTKFLRDDGTWAAASGGGSGLTSLNGLTGATQTFAVDTSGTDFSISSSADVHTFAIPDASATARGLITTGAQTFAGNKSFSGSLSSSFAGTALSLTSTSGAIDIASRILIDVNQVSMRSNTVLGWSNSTTAVSTIDVRLVRDAAATLSLVNSTNAQTFNIANTYTSSTSFEYGRFQWNTNEFRIGTAVGSAGGTQRSTVIGSWNSAGTWAPAVTIGASTGGMVVQSTGSTDPLTIKSPSQSPWAMRILNLTYHATTPIFDFYPQDDGVFKMGTNVATAFQFYTNSYANIRASFSGSTGDLTLTPSAATSGSQTGFTFTAPAPTGQTASTEASMVNWNLASIVTFAAGALTTQRAFRIQAPTYAFASASTMTLGATFAVDGPPTAGTNATITNSYTAFFGSGWVGVRSSPSAGLAFHGGSGSPAVLASIRNDSGAMQFSLGATGIFSCYNGVAISSSQSLMWANAAGAPTAFSTFDLILVRDASATLALRNSTNAQTFRVYNTYTSSTSHEYLKFSWATNVAEIGTVKGSGGGSARDLVIKTDDTTRMTFGASGTATVNTAFVASSTALMNAGSQAFSSSYHLVSWNGGCIGWASGGTVTASSSLDTAFKRVSAGLVEINNGTPGTYGSLILKDLRMSTPTVPVTSSDTGSEGQISWDSNYVYVCTATNTWKRAALSTF